MLVIMCEHKLLTQISLLKKELATKEEQVKILQKKINYSK
jgi:hypothetical protein